MSDTINDPRSTETSWPALKFARFKGGAVQVDDHCHSTYEIAIQLSGTVFQRSATGTRLHNSSLTPGSVYVVAPGQGHAAHCTGEVERLHLFIERCQLDALVAPCDGAPPSLLDGRRPPDPVVTQLFLLLAQTALEKRKVDLYTDSLRASLIGRLLQFIPGVIDGRTLTATELGNLTDYIEATLCDGPRLADLAHLIGLSPFHFARVFKRTTGLSPHQFLVHRRVARAKDLLVHTERSIADIALSLGFASQSHLGLAVKRLAGTTPAALRRSRAPAPS